MVGELHKVTQLVRDPAIAQTWPSSARWAGSTRVLGCIRCPGLYQGGRGARKHGHIPAPSGSVILLLR